MSEEKNRPNYAIYLLLTLIPVGIFVLVMIGSRQDFSPPTFEDYQRASQRFANQMEGTRPQGKPSGPVVMKNPEIVMFFVRTDHEGIDARSFFSFLNKIDKNTKAASLPFLHRVHIESPSADPGDIADETIKKIEQYGSSQNVIIEIIMHYKDDRQISLSREISQKEHPLWINGVMKIAATEMIETAQIFREKYPDIELMATGIGVGVDTLIQAIDRDLPPVKRLILWYPTVTSAENPDFIWSLRWERYDSDTVNVICLDTDPTVETFTELHKEYPGIFKFNIIRSESKTPRVENENKQPIVPSRSKI